MKIKKIIFAGAFLLGINYANAQVNVNINVGTQPLWGPVGYQHVDYYYLPEIETYYYVPKKQFIYINGGNWVFSTALPYKHRHYNLYNGYKVVVNQPYPYKRHKHYKVKYAGYHGPHQVNLRDRDYKYKSHKHHQVHHKQKHKGKPEHHHHHHKR